MSWHSPMTPMNRLLQVITPPLNPPGDGGKHAVPCPLEEEG